VPIHLLFSNLACGLALDRQRRTIVKAVVKYG